MLADMHHRMRAVGLAQPEVERQVAMGWNQIRVVIHRARVDLITPCRLNADEREAKAQSGYHHPAAAKHRIGVRRAPTGVHCIAIFLRQFIERRQVFLQRHALVTRALVDTVQIIGHAAQQLLDQFGASVRQRCQRIALGLHGAQNIQRRSRGIEPHTIADPSVASRVVGENQRHALFAIGQARKLDPAPRQFRDEIHPVRLGTVADHVRLAALTAPGQVLEADRTADDASVQLRQGNVHRQITSAKALFAGLPGRLVVLRADGLNDRHVAPERTQMRRFRTRLSKTGGIEDQLGFSLIQPVLHLSETAGFLEAGHSNGQRIDALRLQARTELVDETGIGGLQVRAIEQQRHHWLLGKPVCLPIGKLRACQARMVDGCARQRRGLDPGIIAVQPATGHAVVQLQRVLQATLTQKLPESVAFYGRHGAQITQFRIRTVITGHQNDLNAACRELHQPLDAVAPVANTAVQRNQNDLCVTQHFIDVQVDRGVILDLHRVGQTQAGVVVGELPGGFGQQRQAGVAAAENHQLGRGLSQIGNIVVRYETAGLGSQ
ncbi:hypothetical protein ALQ37_05552 [Pseudomonas syringae pv. aptata]|uniref:Uncharacterized protein n=1 Tax=Pseudomonas syringae pv. aptata TaxID=83167 RepID=A0A3M3WFF2_PSEAP|nr:hypothetical protein ALQ37_05552 [Pseudomonas syringae pv. aptata]